MSLSTNLVVMVAAVALCACSVGMRRSGALQVPPGAPRNAQDMVNNWDARKKSESRCSWDQAGRQIDPKDRSKTVTPACGDYKP
jgi:hypothetical protein